MTYSSCAIPSEREESLSEAARLLVRELPLSCTDLHIVTKSVSGNVALFFQ